MRGKVRQVVVLVLAIIAASGLMAQQTGGSAPTTNQLQYADRNRLVRPKNYREWIYLSSGLGMAYSPNPNTPPAFTNVFVAPGAYRAFVATGHWPDKTILVLEEREASSKGSINKGGHFQSDVRGIAAAVKDESRFPEKWAYFSFGLDQQSAPANPKEACWQCHNQHGAVDNTFV
ncbi:MAG: cytochrome P460 family protein, partial [Candidatus Acidiferrales bacterium]